MHDIHALDRAAENRMLLVQPGRFLGGDEELRAVGVGPGVGHADRVRLVVAQRGEFVGELGAPDGFAAGAVAERVAGLDHEFADHAVEDGVVVVAGAGVGGEVFDGARGGVGEEADVDVAIGGVEDGGGREVGGFGFRWVLRVREVARFFVLYVAGGFAGFGVVGE